MRRPPGSGGRGAMRSGTGGGDRGPLILLRLNPKLGMDDRGKGAHGSQILPGQVLPCKPVLIQAGSTGRSDPQILALRPVKADPPVAYLWRPSSMAFTNNKRTATTR